MANTARPTKVLTVSSLIENWKWKQSPLIRKRNWAQLATVLSAAVSVDKLVSLTPLGKNLMELNHSSKEIPISSGITMPESKILAELIEFGTKYYGEPVFDYFSVDSNRYEDVDFWRNLIKVGRESGPESASKRIEALESLVSEPVGGKINPNDVHLQWSKDLFASLYLADISSRDKKTYNLVYSSEKSTTNSGEPWYTRKNRVVQGVPVRELIAAESNSLDLDELAQLPAFLGARAQRGKWSVKSDEHYDNPEDIVKYLASSSMTIDEKANYLYKHIGFENYKARIISAAPTIDAYQKSSLMVQLIEAEKSKRSTNSVHLLGPDAVKGWMMKAKRFAKDYENKHGLKLTFYNADATTYDRTLRKEHAQWLYEAIERKIPKYSDKKMCAYMFTSNLTREILYVSEPVTVTDIRNKLKSIRIKETLRSGEVDTNFFGSSVIYLCINAARREVNPEWSKLVDEASKQDLSLSLTDGDDNIAAYIGSDLDTIKADLTNTVKVLEERYGLILQDPTNKGELGYFYTQYRLTDDDRFITPLSRMRLYWKETSKTALPAYTYVVTLFQNLEYRKECKGAKEYVEKFILPYDDTKLGMVDILSGNKIDFTIFRSRLKEEAKKFNRSTAEMIYDGNPYSERLLNSDGDISDDWLKEQWTYWSNELSL